MLHRDVVINDLAERTKILARAGIDYTVPTSSCEEVDEDGEIGIGVNVIIIEKKPGFFQNLRKKKK